MHFYLLYAKSFKNIILLADIFSYIAGTCYITQCITAIKAFVYFLIKIFSQKGKVCYVHLILEGNLGTKGSVTPIMTVLYVRNTFTKWYILMVSM